MNSHSLRACQFTRCIATLPGNIASIKLQYTAPLPNCSILVTYSPKVALTHAMRSLFGTKKAPSIIPMLCYSELIEKTNYNISEYAANEEIN